MKCQEGKIGKPKGPLKVRCGNVTLPIYRGKSKGYDFFTLAYYEGGKRIRRTFSKLQDAKIEAEKAAVRIENGQRDILRLASSDAQDYALALKELQPTGVPLHAAIREYVAAVQYLQAMPGVSLLTAVQNYVTRHNGINSSMAVSEIVQELLAARKQDGVSVRYQQTLRSHLTRFSKAFICPIGSVHAKAIEEWIRGMGLSGRSRNNIRVSLITLFSFARDAGYLPKGEPTEAEGLSVAKDKGGKIGIFAPDQLKTLLYGTEQRKPTPENILYLALGAFTGARSAELIRLEWSEIRLSRNVIEIAADKAKTATRRLIPIPPNLARWLAAYSKEKGRVFVSEKAADRTIDYAKAQKITWPNNVLRHSFASYRLAATQDAAKTALELGNSPNILFKNYRELVTENDAEMWFDISPPL